MSRGFRERLDANVSFALNTVLWLCEDARAVKDSL